MKKLDKKVKALLKNGKVLFLSQIAFDLNADLEDIVKVAKRLMKKGKIKIATGFKEMPKR